MTRRCLMLLLLPAWSPAAWAENAVTVTIVSSEDGKAIDSIVRRRIAGLEDDTPTGSDGTVTFEPMTCAPGTAIRIAPISPLWANVGSWRPCQPNIVVKLRPLGYAEALKPLLGETPAEGMRLAQGSAGFARAKSLQKTLHAASQVGDWHRMAFAADELSRLYASSGDDEIASRYSGIAVHSAAQLISLKYDREVTEPLLVETDGRFVRTQAANRVIGDPATADLWLEFKKPRARRDYILPMKYQREDRPILVHNGPKPTERE